MTGTTADGADAFAAELLATLSNAGLKLDPLTEARLSALEGQSARFEITLPGRAEPLTLTLSVRKASLQFSTDADRSVNAIVRGRLTDLLGWLTAGRSQNLSFDGDDELLTGLGGVLADFRPDLTEPLARLLGEEAAGNLLGLAETALAAARSVLQAAGNSAADQARARFADQPGMIQAIEQAEELALKVDRLRARVTLLEAHPGHGTD